MYQLNCKLCPFMRCLDLIKFMHGSSGGGGGGQGGEESCNLFLVMKRISQRAERTSLEHQLDQRGVRTSMSICNETYTWSYMYTRLVSQELA